MTVRWACCISACFGEVARTTMVRHAFGVLTEDKINVLLAFSDDMVWPRKVPDNVPSKELLENHLAVRYVGTGSVWHPR